MSITSITSSNYNRVFDSETGFFARWGVTMDDDPEMSPNGPEIADIEISTICHGTGKSMETRRPCSFCYKSNTGEGENMSVETFASILRKFPTTLTQIAFGIGDIDSNPDLWDILTICRASNVVPNLTVNGMGISGDTAYRLAHICGAVAVSHYGDDLCFNAVEALTQAGLKQINIHKLLSEETYASCFSLVDKVKSDPRLKGLKAIVFLLLKPKGDRNHLTPLKDLAAYQVLVEYAQSMGVAVGMDSCSAPMALKTLPEACIPSIEPCESTLFSIYLSVKGEVFPCSFTEGTTGWERGIPMSEVKSFKDVWYHPRLIAWRTRLLISSSNCACDKQKHCRSCPVYDVTICNPKPSLSDDKLVQIEVMA
jgi:MoaA/NifB/PqqE/SkfB family radical SAM enzyme